MADEAFHLFTSLRYDAALVDLPASGFINTGWNSARPSACYMLDFHRDRMLRAATHWGWERAVAAISGGAGLETLEAYVAGAVAGEAAGPLRVKVVLTSEGELDHETSPVPETPLSNLFPVRLPAPGRTGGPTSGDPEPRKEPAYEVVLDARKTERSEYTHFKTTRRAMYDAARQRAGISQPGDRKEVLIIHEDNDLIMEGSTTTPYFWRNGRWVTPPVAARYSSRDGSGGQDGTSRRWALER